MKSFLIFLVLFLFGFGTANAQNLVPNADFEQFTVQPNNQGQVTNCIGWEDVVYSSDYMNTGYAPWTPDYGGAYNGTGYMGFATYGSANGACEAIGVSVAANPLMPGVEYQIDIAVKMTTGPSNLGAYDQICSGFVLMGFASSPVAVTGVHASDIVGSNYLWTSPMITDSIWSIMSGTFFVSAQTNYLVFTLEKETCPQYAFIDNITIEEAEPCTSPPVELGPDQFLCFGDSLQLDASANAGTYLWQDGSTDSVLTVYTAGIYSVEVTDSCGTVSDNVEVFVLNCDTIVQPPEVEIALRLPNVFSPNADAHNDLFTPLFSSGIEKMHTEIFNRWGQIVHTSDELLIQWNGGDAPEGVYYWVIRYTDINGEEKEMTGILQLLR